MFRGSLIFTNFALKKDVQLSKIHLFRFASIGLVFILFFSSWLSSARIGSPGLDFFTKIVWLNFWLVTLAGIGIFSTAITEEKEEETLPLLKLAGISSLGLLLGKSTVRAVRIILLILAQLPFLILAVALGGITPLQIFATLLAMLAYVILISNLSLLCSVYARRSGTAIALVMILLFFLFVLPMLLSETFANLQSRGLIDSQGFIAQGVESILHLSQQISVTERFQTILQVGFKESVLSMQVVSNILLGVVAFFAAWACFEPWSLRIDAGRVRNPKPSLKTRLRNSRPGQMAFVWKEFQFNSGGKQAFILKLVIYPLLVVLITAGGMFLDGFSSVSFISSYSWRGMMSTSLLLLSAGFIVESTMYVSQMFRDEHRQKMLPIMLLLPHSLSRIIYEKTVGLSLALIPVVSGMLLIVMLAPDSLLEMVDISWQIYIPLIMVQYVVFLHLLAYYSLVVRWGALAIAIGSLILFQACLTPFLQIMYFFFHFSIGANGIIMPAFYLSLISCVVLQFLISGKLRQIAAEE